MAIPFFLALVISCPWLVLSEGPEVLSGFSGVKMGSLRSFCAGTRRMSIVVTAYSVEVYFQRSLLSPESASNLFLLHKAATGHVGCLI